MAIDSMLLKHFPIRTFFLSVHLTNGAARVAKAGIRTHVSRVEPTWDLLKDSLSTERLFGGMTGCDSCLLCPTKYEEASSATTYFWTEAEN